MVDTKKLPKRADDGFIGKIIRVIRDAQKNGRPVNLERLPKPD